ncbi:MAG: tetratricopeptide repeat protein [Phycisphaerae bacterium]
MKKKAKSKYREEPSPAGMVIGLQIVAFAVVLVGCLCGGWAVLTGLSGRPVGWPWIGTGAGIALSAIAMGVLLWGLSWVIRRQHQLWMRQQGFGSGPPAGGQAPETDVPDPPEPPQKPTDTARPGRDEQLYQELLDAIDQLNQTLLMSPEQRQARVQRRRSQMKKTLLNRFRQQLDAGDLAAAGHTLETFQDELPEEPEGDEMEQQLADERREAEVIDVSDAIKTCEDLMAVGRFDDARSNAEDLLKRHPDSVRAVALADRVHRETAAFRNEHRNRLYMDLEKAVENRRWVLATDAAKRFLEMYPDAVEAELVEAQLHTLEDNARIERVRKHRDEIRDLLNRRRYPEALEIAEQVIKNFPGTQAAVDLEQQLPRLREKATLGNRRTP